jgi:hypothetical protein
MCSLYHVTDSKQYPLSPHLFELRKYWPHPKLAFPSCDYLKYAELIVYGRQCQCFQSLETTQPVGSALLEYKVFETIRRMSQVLSMLGDRVGAVIDNEVTGNRWLGVIAGMSFRSSRVRPQKSQKRNVDIQIGGTDVKNTSSQHSSLPLNGVGWKRFYLILCI